ncbi:MAG TPA: SH3 domain-containing protein [Planctomycetota bacterium]|nr:SH3 domain-containing protein [Planctomycetota bacterium]
MRWMVAGGVLAAFVVLALAQEKRPGGMRLVQVREAVLRDKPSFLGKVVARLPYGAGVVVEESRGEGWVRVRAEEGRAAGWLSASALATDVAKLKGGSGSAEERAGTTSRSLAGRGFDEEVEAKRRAGGGDIALGYRRLDELLALPAYNPDAADVPAFAAEGGLGGAR